MNKELRRLLNKVNRVTAYHRHGNPVPAKALDDLSNAQLDYETAVERHEEIANRASRGLK